MHFLSMSENGHLAFTGRHRIHIYSTRYIGSKTTRLHIEGSGALTSIELLKYLPDGYTGAPGRISAISCSISRDGRKLVVVDSEKNVYVFEKYEPEPNARESAAVVTMRHRSVWYFFASFKMDMKIIRGQFDKFTENLFLIDKHGNVLISSTESPETISHPVQLVDHRAVTLDLIHDESGQMLFTCDGLANILYSFYGVDKSKEGGGQAPGEPRVKAIRITPPTTEIANFVLFKKDGYMLLAHKDGTIDLWDFDAAKHLQSWNIFKIVHGMDHEQAPEHEIQRLKLTEAYDHAYFAVKLATYKEMPIFHLDLPTRKLRKLGQVRLDYEYSDFVWSEKTLYVYNPENTTLIKKYTVSENGVLCDPHFHITTVLEHLPDFKSFVDFNKETIALSDYISNASVRSYPGRRAVHEIFRTTTDDKITHSLFTSTKKRVAKNPAVDGNKSSATIGSVSVMDKDKNEHSAVASKATILPIMRSSGSDADISNFESDDEPAQIPKLIRGLSRIPIAQARRSHPVQKQTTKTKTLAAGQGK